LHRGNFCAAAIAAALQAAKVEAAEVDEVVLGRILSAAAPKDVLQNAILPQIPVRRLGRPEEIARCVLFLASDDAGLITGSTLSANGGQYMA
jgi:NAD(P)-dependent dehydrogenase (short-subunit alcohol dehydrogenase family)